jgi:hypothetical protein
LQQATNADKILQITPPEQFPCRPFHRTSGLENVIICHGCYNELTSKSETLELARAFSERNGYGPVANPSIDRAVELDVLLRSLTSVEEAAIRQVTPLISIVRLKHGYIGTKGIVSSVWQKARWSSVLPNLPSECSMIVVQRTARQTQVGLPAYKFKRVRIHRVLFLLQETKAEPWDKFALSNENLYQWPEEGNLCDFANRVEAPEEVTGQGEEETEMDNANDDRIEDAGDSGPVPLQNGVEPDETFTGTEQRGGRTGSILEGAVNGPAVLSEAAAMLRAQVEEQKEDDEEKEEEEEEDEADAETSRVLPRIHLNADGTEAVVDQTILWTCDGPSLHGQWHSPPFSARVS